MLKDEKYTWKNLELVRVRGGVEDGVRLVRAKLIDSSEDLRT